MDKFLRKTSSILSTVFSPLLVPTYGVMIGLSTTVLALIPLSTRLSVGAVVLMLTCLLPMLLIGLMWKGGYLSDPGLNKQTERTIPYIITAATFLAAAIYLWRLRAPMWLVMFPTGGLLAAVISLIVNRRWKISAHMAAMGGLFGIVCRIAVSDFAIVNMVWWVALTAVCCGLVAMARLVLNRHTPGQVIAGFVNGFVCVLLLSLLF